MSKCSKCRHREASPDYRTCDGCREYLRLRERKGPRRPDGRVNLPAENDQIAIPKPRMYGPGTMHTCASCVDYTRCHLTKLEDGHEYWICIGCNTKSAEYQDQIRRCPPSDPELMWDNFRDRVDAAYKRIVPEKGRGDYQHPEAWEPL